MHISHRNERTLNIGLALSFRKIHDFLKPLSFFEEAPLSVPCQPLATDATTLRKGLEAPPDRLARAVISLGVLQTGTAAEAEIAACALLSLDSEKYITCGHSWTIFEKHIFEPFKDNYSLCPAFPAAFTQTIPPIAKRF
jgi:hypothetical protein